MARVEDLEVLVGLVSGGLTSLRADLRAVRRELAELQAVVGQPLQVTVAREQATRAAAPAAPAALASCARASRTRPTAARRSCAPTRPDTPSSHPRVDPSPAAAAIVAACGNEDRQASRPIALIAAALALAAALLLGVARLGPPLAATLGAGALGRLAPGTPTAPGLDGLERALLAGATSPDADGPTLLDLRTRLRSRLGSRRRTPRSPRPSAPSSLARSRRRCRSTPTPGSRGVIDRADGGRLAARRAFTREQLGRVPGLRVEPGRHAGRRVSRARSAISASPRIEPSDGIAARHSQPATSSSGARRRYREVVLRRACRMRGSDASWHSRRALSLTGGSAALTGARVRRRPSTRVCSRLAAVLGASLALIAGPPLASGLRSVLACSPRQDASGRRAPAVVTAADIADVQSALLPGDAAVTPDAALLALERRHGREAAEALASSVLLGAARASVPLARQRAGRIAPGSTSQTVHTSARARPRARPRCRGPDGSSPSATWVTVGDQRRAITAAAAHHTSAPAVALDLAARGARSAESCETSPPGARLERAQVTLLPRAIDRARSGDGVVNLVQRRRRRDPARRAVRRRRGRLAGPPHVLAQWPHRSGAEHHARLASPRRSPPSTTGIASICAPVAEGSTVVAEGIGA